MPGIIRRNEFPSDIDVDCLIVGGGAAGLTAALAAHEAGATVLIAERETRLSGSTALSSGLIPAAGTRAQQAQRIDDSEDIFCADILHKNCDSADPIYVQQIVQQISKTIDWLSESYNIPFHVLDNFLYPGHSNHRMHAVPETTGIGLINRLEAAVAAKGIFVVTDALITDLIVDQNDMALGALCQRPNKDVEHIAASSVILACNGYGGNPDLIAKHIPEMKDALYFGHPGNQGEAIIWGAALGLSLRICQGIRAMVRLRIRMAFW